MRKSPRRIAVVTGTRAEYGLLRWLMNDIRDCPELVLQTLVTGQHLVPEFGHTIDEIRGDGFAVDAEIDLLLSGDTRRAMAVAVGVGVVGFAGALDRLDSDIVVVLGDRFETLAAAEAALLLGIPIAHIHGGEVTEGAVDESIRHAISKMSALHFVSAEPYRRRLIRMGELPARVVTVGAPGLDQLKRLTLAGRDELMAGVGLDPARPFLLVTYHPATRGAAAATDSLAALLRALDRFPDHQLLMTKANADAGGRAINAALQVYVAERGSAVLAASLGSRLYLSALREAAAVVGNSSSGIIEAPAVGTPTVNIGPRQQGRLRAACILDCDEDETAVAAAITAAIDPAFRAAAAAKGDPPPYGRPGDAAGRIVAALRAVDPPSLHRKPFFDAGLDAAGEDG
jgi:UDP-N-acetylglucosamine 2-epimerase (non-hydrolysing)